MKGRFFGGDAFPKPGIKEDCRKATESLDVSERFHIFAIVNRDGQEMNPKVSNTIKEYFKTQPVEKAWVFGSFSRGEERPESDVDIMISLRPGTRLGLQFFAMSLELERLLNRPVDLVIEGDLLPFAEKTANHDKILVYARV